MTENLYELVFHYKTTLNVTINSESFISKQISNFESKLINWSEPDYNDPKSIMSKIQTLNNINSDYEDLKIGIMIDIQRRLTQSQTDLYETNLVKHQFIENYTHTKSVYSQLVYKIKYLQEQQFKMLSEMSIGLCNGYDRSLVSDMHQKFTQLFDGLDINLTEKLKVFNSELEEIITFQTENLISRVKQEFTEGRKELDQSKKELSETNRLIKDVNEALNSVLPCLLEGFLELEANLDRSNIKNLNVLTKF